MSNRLHPLFQRKCLLLQRDFQIWRLVQLGWTQSEVGSVYGVDGSVISRIVQNIRISEIAHIQAQYSKKKSVEDIVL